MLFFFHMSDFTAHFAACMAFYNPTYSLFSLAYLTHTSLCYTNLCYTNLCECFSIVL